MLSFEDKILIENHGKLRMYKNFFDKRLLKRFPNNGDILNTSYKKLLTYPTKRLILLLGNEIQ